MEPGMYLSALGYTSSISCTEKDSLAKKTVCIHKLRAKKYTKPLKGSQVWSTKMREKMK